jgi:Tfp pilus assembly protein PilO
VTSILDKLNLSPQERRLVVVIAIVVFVVLNIWLIWPEFGSVAIWKQRRADAERRLKQFKDEISNQGKYKRQLAELEVLGGQIGTEEQALSLQRDVSTQALLSGVQVNRYDPQARMATGGRTNAFFEEQGTDYHCCYWRERACGLFIQPRHAQLPDPSEEHDA